MWRMVQDGGWPAMLALFIGVLALFAGIFGAAAIGFSKRTAFVVGAITLALASLAGIVGALGVAVGHGQVERALAAIENAATVERILGVGYAEAANAGKIGFGVAILPMLLGATAALVGSRAQPPMLVPHFGPPDAFRGPTPPAGPPRRPGMGRTFAAIALAAVALLSALGALAMSLTRPPPGKYALDLEDAAGWHVAEAHETIAIPGKLADGCDELDDALKDLRSSPTGKVPVQFSRDPDTIVPGTRAEANRCARDVFDRIKRGHGSATHGGGPWGRAPIWTADTLLDSPLLLDDALRAEVRVSSPPSRARGLD